MSWDNSGIGGGSWHGGGAHVATGPFDEPASIAGDPFGGGDNPFGGDEAGAVSNGGGNGGGCFNCGEEGHIKAECTNKTVVREFTGTCRLCEQQGHMASACPTAPPKLCKNCQQEGHAAAECENARANVYAGVDDIPAEQAWAAMVAASDERDLDDFKEALRKYVKATPATTYVELETAFREQNFNVFLIAIEKDLASTYTNMDLQGNLGKKHSVSFRFSDKYQRPKEKEFWPASPEENRARLADAGEPVDCGKPKCSNCNQLGHTKKNCPEEITENADQAQVKCFNCDAVGHRVRDCPDPRPDKFACRNCHQSGHSSKECTEPRSAEGVECKKCNEVGHFSKDCPQNEPCRNCGGRGHFAKYCTEEKKIICRNCDEEGHVGKDCPKPRDYSRLKCSNCQEMGHTKIRCKQPIVEEDGANGGGYGGAGNSGGDSFGNSGGDPFGNSGGDPFGASGDKPFGSSGDGIGGGGDSFDSAGAPVAPGGW